MQRVEHAFRRALQAEILDRALAPEVRVALPQRLKPSFSQTHVHR